MSKLDKKDYKYTKTILRNDDFLLLRGKFITILFFSIVCIMFILIIIFGFIKFTNTNTIDDIDVLSFQISLLEIIIAVISIAGGLFAFLGWKELLKVAKQEVSESIKEFQEKSMNKIIEHVLNKIKNDKLLSQESKQFSSSEKLENKEK